MISNILGREGLGTATGVDLAGHRLATCRSLLKKYKVGEKVRLFEADGTLFSVPPPSRLGNKIIHQDEEGERHKRQKVEFKPFWACRMLRYETAVNSKALYDKVLVDAECTHDGSISHILKVHRKNMSRVTLGLTFTLYRNSTKSGAGMHLRKTLWTPIGYLPLSNCR